MAAKKSTRNTRSSTTAPREHRVTKPLTLADVMLHWTDDSGHQRDLRGQDVAALIRRRLFFGSDAGETPLWQCRLRGLSALMFPEAGISIHEADGRALVSDLLNDAAAGIALEAMDLGQVARGFTITPRKAVRS